MFDLDKKSFPFRQLDIEEFKKCKYSTITIINLNL